ncbi:hypothetical protein KKG58_03865 [Patescibacteria group bacterium]|nr:hypothetical protein [Patescibacteria group bacterium]
MTKKKKCSNVLMFKCLPRSEREAFYYWGSNDKRGISLVLTLLIISSVLTGTILVADITIRHAQIIHGAEISEKAYFATETGIQKSAYQALKNYTDISTYSLSGTLDDGESTYTATVSVDTECPNPPTECSAGAISATNAWTISLSAGESFQLNIDINGTIYPASVQITRSGSTDTDIIVYECTTTTGTPRVCGETMSQEFSITFPYTFNITNYATKYYKLRINNAGSSSENYVLTPTGALPIGIEISSIGVYTGYERRLKTNLPKWQKFGI